MPLVKYFAKVIDFDDPTDYGLCPIHVPRLTKALHVAAHKSREERVGGATGRRADVVCTAVSGKW